MVFSLLIGLAACAAFHETVAAVFDSNKNAEVSLDEVLSTLDGLAAMSAMGMGDPPGPDGTNAATDLTARIRAAKRFAPVLLNLMDVDGNGSLSRPELAWLTKAPARVGGQRDSRHVERADMPMWERVLARARITLGVTRWGFCHGVRFARCFGTPPRLRRTSG